MKKEFIKKLAAFTAAVYACTLMPVSVSFAADGDLQPVSVSYASGDESSIEESDYSGEDESDEESSTEEYSYDEDESSMEEQNSSEDESYPEEESSTEDESSLEESSLDESSLEESSLDESSGEDESSEDPEPIDISTLKSQVSDDSYTYTGSAITPDVTITDGGRKLVKGTDYTLSYQSNTNAGTAKVTVMGIGNYTGTTTLSFTIAKADISGIKASIPALNYTYTGTAREPEPTLKFNGKKLVKGTDYTVTYKNNVNVGSLTARVTMTGKGNFTGSTYRDFNITARSVSSCTIASITDRTYNGKAWHPEPSVKYDNIKFTKGTDYTYSYSNNTNTGTATVTITGKGRLTGSKSVTFKIVPLNVLDFGAKPNDSGDDRDAINKALYKAKDIPSTEKVEVYVPAGTYYIASNSLYIYSNTRLILDKNAKIISKLTEKVMIVPLDKNNKADGTGGYGLAHDIYISGGTWDANANNQKKTVSKAIMLFRNSKNITVTDTTLTHVYGNHFIICDGVSGLTVTNVKFNDFVSYTGAASSYEFYSGMKTANEKKSAIGSIEALHIDFATDKTPCTNVKVSGCTFSNVPAGIGTHHTNTKKATSITIWDNTFTNVWFYCVHASSFNSTKVYNNTATNVLGIFRCEDTTAEVYGNTMKSITSAPTSRYDRDNWLYSVVIQNNSSVNFHDNTLTSPFETGVRFKNNGTLTNTFKNNTVTGCGRDGMFIEAAKVTVTYNTFKTVKAHGLRVQNAKVTATNNNITGCKETAAFFYGGCTSSSFKNNGIDSGAKITIAKDSSVTNSDNKASISGMKASIPYASYTYTGKAIKPTVTVKNGSTKIAASNYTVTYSSNTKVGVATILIEGKGSYRGFLKKTFIIKPKPQSLTLTTTSGAFKAAWTKDTTATGYQIQYSKDKTFKTGVTTYTVTKNTTTSVNFSSKPVTGETWYVKYRAYYETNGSKYGNYSSVKSIKIK